MVSGELDEIPLPYVMGDSWGWGDEGSAGMGVGVVLVAVVIVECGMYGMSEE